MLVDSDGWPRDRDQHIYVRRAVQRAAVALCKDRCGSNRGSDLSPEPEDFTTATNLIITECEAGRIPSGYARQDGMIIAIPTHRLGSEDALVFCAFGDDGYFPVFLERTSFERFERGLSRPEGARRGRPKKHYWDAVKEETFRLMGHHGEFTPGDHEWNAQARLEEALLDFCSRRFGEEPAIGGVRSRLQKWLLEWRGLKRSKITKP